MGVLLCLILLSQYYIIRGKWTPLATGNHIGQIDMFPRTGLFSHQTQQPRTKRLENLVVFSLLSQAFTRRKIAQAFANCAFQQHCRKGRARGRHCNVHAKKIGKCSKFFERPGLKIEIWKRRHLMLLGTLTCIIGKSKSKSKSKSPYFTSIAQKSQHLTNGKEEAEGALMSYPASSFSASF